MTDLPIQSEENSFIKFFKLIGKFILKLLGLDGSQRKCVCKSKCSQNCCCKSCELDVVYDEKEEDTENIDICITPTNGIQVY